MQGVEIKTTLKTILMLMMLLHIFQDILTELVSEIFVDDNENIGGVDACQESRSKTQGRRRGQWERCALQVT